MIIHKNILVKGRVQGVGFRFHTMEKAKALGVKGYVQNLHDGSVYIEAEGAENDVNELVNWCKNGPAWANVDKISVGDDKISGFSSFNIKH